MDAKKKDVRKDEVKAKNNKSPTRSVNRSTSSSVKGNQTDDDIHSRKFNFSPSPQPTVINTQHDFSVRVINTTKEKISAIESVEMNQLGALKEVIKENPLEMMKTDSKGRTLMSIACENGFENIVKYIADNNDSLISVDTPLGNKKFIYFFFVKILKIKLREIVK